MIVVVISGGTSPWLEQKTSYGHVYYYNNETGETSWTKPADFKDNSSLLTKEDIQVRFTCNIHLHFFQ